MSQPYRILVRLWANPGGIAEFRLFEDQAMEIMKDHGAAILNVSNPPVESNDTPYEIHELEFPSHAQFEAYRSDERLAELSGLRAKGIAKTEIERLV